ncbi:MAG TPA: MDR family MFS transporter [Chloroflexia bacterium]|nr:MDR family MFS transporter [Chloroflexia bacterium]
MKEYSAGQPIQSDGSNDPASVETVNTTTRQKVMVIIGVMLGMLLAALDQTIVGTAMPRVIAELNGLEHYAWVFTAYMLTSTVSVPIYGKLSDIYGRRLFFVTGMVLFLIGSALSGMSQDMVQLILFRALQGLGAGAMMPIAQAIIGDIFPPAERGKWQGLMMAIFGLSTIAGPTLGGWITDNLGWRWVFYVNLPLGIVAIAVAGFVLPKSVRRQNHKIDYLGTVTLIGSAVPLLLAFSWAGTQYPWLSGQIIGLLTVAVVMGVIFFLTERKATEPIISPSLFSNSIFSVSVIAVFLLSVGMMGSTMYLPLFVQGVIGESATGSGVILTPMMLGFMVSSIVGGQLMSRTGRYKFLALFSFFLGAIGMALLAMMSINTTSLEVVRNMVVTGLGIGAGMSLFTIVVQNAFNRDKLGEVTAGLTFFRSIGGTIGVAILGTVMSNTFQNSLQSNLPETFKKLVPPDKIASLQNPQILLSPGVTDQIKKGFSAFGPQGQELFNQLMTAIRQSLVTAITGLFWVAVISMVLALIVTLFLKEIPLRKTLHHPVAEAIEEVSPGPEAALSGEVDLDVVEKK